MGKTGLFSEVRQVRLSIKLLWLQGLGANFRTYTDILAYSLSHYVRKMLEKKGF